MTGIDVCLFDSHEDAIVTDPLPPVYWPPHYVTGVALVPYLLYQPPMFLPVRVAATGQVISKFDRPWPVCVRCGVPGCVCEWCASCQRSVNPYRHFTASHRDISMPGMPYYAAPLTGGA